MVRTVTPRCLADGRALLFQLIRGPRDQADIDALAREPLRDAKPDALRTAGDECGAAGKLQVHCFPLGLRNWHAGFWALAIAGKADRHPICDGSHSASIGNEIKITSRIRSVMMNGSTPAKMVEKVTSCTTLLITNTFMPTGG